jgi:hypothetical protein
VSDHTRTLVPIEAWSYSSPELRTLGKTIDIGLFAESLVYYDRVLLNVANATQLAELLRWCLEHNCYNDLLALISDGTVEIYDYAFVTAPVKTGDTYTLLNIQDAVQAKAGTFEQRYLYHPDVDRLFWSTGQKKKLYKAFRGHVIEVKADEFGAAVENATTDALNPPRLAMLVQSLLDELYRSKILDAPPTPVQSEVTRVGEGRHRLGWSVDLDHIGKLLGPGNNFNPGTPLAAAAICNRLLWSSAQLTCDLFLARPMSNLVGDKLQESASRSAKPQVIIEQLQAEVEFPNVHALVNADGLDFGEVLRIRSKAQRFRQWLQSESDRDRNAIIAYHNEVAKELGIATAARRALEIFGVLSVTGLSAYLVPQLEPALSAPMAGAVGAVVGIAGSMLIDDLSARLHTDWKPIVFGNWMTERITEYLRSAEIEKRFE